MQLRMTDIIIRHIKIAMQYYHDTRLKYNAPMPNIVNINTFVFEKTHRGIALIQNNLHQLRSILILILTRLYH